MQRDLDVSAVVPFSCFSLPVLLESTKGECTKGAFSAASPQAMLWACAVNYATAVSARIQVKSQSSSLFFEADAISLGVKRAWIAS